MMNKHRKHLNPYLLVIVSFALIIVIGSFLLMMPFAHKDGLYHSYIDSLFMSTSATCVTGLNCFNQGIVDELTFFGQLIMLILMQIGGLGFITVFTFIFTLFGNKLQFKDRYFISVMVNSDDSAQIVSFIRKIILISFSFELGGFLLGLPIFIIYSNNVLEGLWKCCFTAVSSYNNAGFDLFGNTSLIRGVGNPFIDALPLWVYYYLLSYIMILVIAGGISFLVIMDIVTKKHFKHFRIFSKISLLMTGILLISGLFVFHISENFTSPFNAMFQSVTTRTAGFSNVAQDDLSYLGKIFSCILMFIGGNSLGTAGGIKTTTIYIVVLAMISYLTGRKVTSFHRRYSSNVVVKAMSLVLISLATILLSYLIIYSVEDDTTFLYINSNKSTAIIYETFSAFGTVGLSLGITPHLSQTSKILITILMFVGRIGPITFFQLLNNHIRFSDQEKSRFVEEDCLIG